MGFVDLFTLLLSNLGVSFETMVMIVFLIPCLLFFASDFKVGILSSILIASGLFIWAYVFEFEYDRIILLILALLVVLSLTIFFISRKVDRGGAFI
jgi:hypothetical protein